MKTIILFFFLTVQYFAQVQGCVWTATLQDTGEVDYYQCRSASEWWFITVALIDSSDTIKVYSGTNLPDSTYEDEVYSLIGLKDLTTGNDVEVITGDEARHTYLPLYGVKRKNLKIEATAWSDTLTYYVETY